MKGSFNYSPDMPEVLKDGDGTYWKQGLDTSPLYKILATTLKTGALYTLLGELCMDGWSHNTKLDAAGNFIGRDEATTCQLWVFTESGKIKCYNAASAATNVSPVWTLTYSQDITTGAVTLGAALPVGSGGTSLATAATGGILHAPSTNALAMLAIGAADYKLFVNAAGTLPEYASGVYSGYFTKDLSAASDTQTISGVPFRPAVVIFICCVPGVLEASIGFWAGNGIGFCIWQYAGSLWGSSVYSIASPVFLSTNGTAYRYVSGFATTSDGFTATWTKFGSPTGTAYIHYLALR